MVGPSTRPLDVLQQKDGTIITDKAEKLERWIQHYSELYNRDSNASLIDIQAINTAPTMNQPDDEPTPDETTKTILNLKNNKAAGEDGISGDLLRVGLLVL